MKRYVKEFKESSPVRVGYTWKTGDFDGNIITRKIEAVRENDYLVSNSDNDLTMEIIPFEEIENEFKIDKKSHIRAIEKQKEKEKEIAIKIKVDKIRAEEEKYLSMFLKSKSPKQKALQYKFLNNWFGGTLLYKRIENLINHSDAYVDETDIFRFDPNRNKDLGWDSSTFKRAGIGKTGIEYAKFYSNLKNK